MPWRSTLLQQGLLCRGLHSVTAVGDKLYLFGGAPQKGGMLNDLWVLDVASMQWTELHPEGELPHKRCSHTAVVMGTSIFIFGGSYYRYIVSGLKRNGKRQGAMEKKRRVYTPLFYVYTLLFYTDTPFFSSVYTLILYMRYNPMAFASYTCICVPFHACIWQCIPLNMF